MYCTPKALHYRCLPIMITTNYLATIIIIYFLNCFQSSQCQLTNQYDRIVSHKRDHLTIKHIPAILHNENVYLTILYKCSSLLRRRISLSIHIDETLYRSELAVFRRHWFCHSSTRVKTRYVRVKLHRLLAYKSDTQAWPIEQGQLKLIMYSNEQANDNDIMKKLEYTVRFLPMHQRPSFHSFRWHPLMNKRIDGICRQEPEIVRIINHPLVLTGGTYGKYFLLPAYRDYSLRLEQQRTLTRPKFSIVLWLYIDEYCANGPYAYACAIFQHITFNNTHLTPEIFINREGQVMVNMYGYLHDLQGTGGRTFASIPKRDWCRVAFIVDEFKWNIYINCLQTWEQPAHAVHYSPIYYYSNDQWGTFVVGGSDIMPTFRGFVSQVDIYRRVALTYEQLPKKLDPLFTARLPSIIQQSNECKRYIHSFEDSREQSHRFHQRLRERFTCDAQVFPWKKSPPQCLIVRTWKQHLRSMSDVRYRIYRAFRRRTMNSINQVADKLFDLTIKLLSSDDLDQSCDQITTWLEQAVCYGHPSAHSLLATLHQFGLCGLQRNSTRALELILSGALLNDRISLLALGHRYFYGLDGFPQDYDAAYVYYQQMGQISKHEFYNPKSNEATMERIRLTDEKLLDELTFDKSDSFYWLKQQARRGVASAQYHLGELMFAGRNGLTRNVQAAVEYFRLGAAQHDATSHFSYGLALLKGQGAKQNVTEAIRHIEKAVENGYLGAQVALGYHAYEIEKNYTKAAQLWRECFDRTYDAYCAHNLGVMWTAGRYPPSFVVDHVQAWGFYSFAAKRGQIDSKTVVAHYNARGGHPSIVRDGSLAAIWARHVAEDSSALGTVVRRAIEAYREQRWRTSFLFYMQAAFAGAELGYFNAAYLCQEVPGLINQSSFDCVEQLLKMYLTIHADGANIDPYALLTVAEHYRGKDRNSTKAMQLYVQLYRSGDSQGLYNLAQMEEESYSNFTIPMDIWSSISVTFDHTIVTSRNRRLQAIYQHCRITKADESYIPCTLAYLRISTIILLEERSKIVVTVVFVIFSMLIFMIRL